MLTFIGLCVSTIGVALLYLKKRKQFVNYLMYIYISFGKCAPILLKWSATPLVASDVSACKIIQV